MVTKADQPCCCAKRHASANADEAGRESFPASDPPGWTLGEPKKPCCDAPAGRRQTVYGIPDIELPMAAGGTVNPGDFAGHELVVLFCPLDPAAAELELADYNRLSPQFSYNDAWMIAIGHSGLVTPASRFTFALERDPGAWRAFGESLDPPEQLPREQGAVFLFGRGGCLTRVWRGPGHASEVARELGNRM